MFEAGGMRWIKYRGVPRIPATSRRHGRALFFLQCILEVSRNSFRQSCARMSGARISLQYGSPQVSRSAERA